MKSNKKIIKKEFKFSFIKDKTNYEDIQEVYCDSKSLTNKIMLILTSLFAIVVGYFIGKIFYFDFIDKRLSYNFTNIISVLGVLLLTISPAIYYILKMKNFKFYIDNEKINYKNILGKRFSYSLTEILKADFFTSIGEETVDSIVIRFTDKRKIRLSSTDRNFKLLKSFLISKNILEK